MKKEKVAIVSLTQCSYDEQLLSRGGAENELNNLEMFRQLLIIQNMLQWY